VTTPRVLLQGTRTRVKKRMRTRIETRRLILRPFEPADTEAAFAWFGDPVVMRFTPTGPDKSIEETRKRLSYFENHQQEHGFSKWVVLNKTSGVAIGDSGLLVLPECGWIDLGFRLAQPHWGQGLATEAASAWVRAGFDEYRIHQLAAFVHPKNVASIRVLEKLGFHAERQDTVMGMESIVFSLHADGPIREPAPD
jgi:ribosomal-protein-alanine N-acetyltransferase